MFKIFNYAFSKTEDLKAEAISRGIMEETDTVDRSTIIDLLKQYDKEQADKNPEPVVNPAIENTEAGPNESEEEINSDWSQESQKYPNRFYQIRKVLDHVDKDDKKVMNEIPCFYKDGVWFEDEACKVECGYWENLSPAEVEHKRALNEIR
jgi:hypothetical protein